MSVIRNRERGMMRCAFAVILAWTLGIQAALPPDPNNAALLYYQAFAAHGQWNASFNAPMRGEAISEEAKKCFRDPSWRHTMAILHAADRCTQCDWGILYSDGQGLNDGTYEKLRNLGFHLDVYARVLCEGGESRAAMETCLTMLRLAGRMDGCTRADIGVSQTVSREALNCIQHVLSSSRVDTDTLMWLRAQLATMQGTAWRPEVALRRMRDMEVQKWHAHPDALAMWRRGLEKLVQAGITTVPDEQYLDRALQAFVSGVTDEEMLARAVRTYDDFLAATLPVITAGAPYGQTSAQLRALETRFSKRDFLDIPGGSLFTNLSTPEFYYDQHIRKMVLLNAARAATDIYLVVERAGRSPEALPEGLVKDPYSTQDFQYRRTDDGFVLGFDPGHTTALSKREFEFKAQAR